MECRECAEYQKCSITADLRIKRRRCERAKQMRKATNEEVLRMLRGEALVEFLYKNMDAYCLNKPECGLALDNDLEIAASECKKCLAAWLKKEAEI